MAGELKRHGPLAAKAIKTRVVPLFEELEDLKVQGDGNGGTKARAATTKEKLRSEIAL